MAITVRHLKVSTIADDPAAAAAGEVLPSDWNDDHEVAIDALDGAPIGSTTPAAGTFTTLTATGQTSLGGVASSESVIVPASLSSGGTVLYAHGGTASGTTGGRVYAGGSATDVPLLLASKGSGGSIKFFTNESSYSSTWSNRQLQVAHTASAVNYVQVTGAATTKATVISSAGSDSNISSVFQSKGTGAIDLAAGSKGVNISNGGTVTAITRTNSGSGYSTAPSVAITAPNTAGGVQATATVNIGFPFVAIVSGGTGYTVNDVITIVGGTFSSAGYLTVTSVSGGVITGVSIGGGYGQYTVAPTNPVSVSGGTGSGATFNLTGWTINGNFTITNAGSGYVEQPTVSFSGGGGSGAAAYATVGSDTTVKSLGTSLFLSHPNGVGLQVRDNGQTSCYPLFQSSGTTVQTYASSATASNVGYQWATKGVSGHSFATNNSVGNIQFNVAHTASAVNYVQVTGAATGGFPAISAQGSDTNVTLRYNGKGSGGHLFYDGNGAAQFRILPVASTANYLQVTSSIAGSAPILSSQGSDTNIDLSLIPKGTGNVRFGTYTANMALTVQGYIEIKDSGGTVRKLAVIA